MRAMRLYARGYNYKYKYKKSRNNLPTINLINQVFIAEQKKYSLVILLI